MNVVMTRKAIFAGILLSVVFGWPSHAEQNDFPDLKGPYFGQTAPVDAAEIFMEGIISTREDPEMCAVFNADGKTFYYNALYENRWTIFVTRESNGRWTRPEPMAFTAGYTDRDFTMSPDGGRIFFGSDRPREPGGPRQSALDIFMTKRLPSGAWSMQTVVGPPVSTEAGENYPSVALSGNLYFFSKRNDGIGLCDIYTSSYVNGIYQPPIPLDSSVNSVKNDWDAYIAPDESYIIFSSQNRDDTIGKQDLYISFKGSNKEWTKAVNMGSLVNSSDDEICPSVSLDGKYLFFTTRRRGTADIYWMDARIIEKLK